MNLKFPNLSRLTMLSVLVLAASSLGARHISSTYGDDDNPGTAEEPKRSWDYCFEMGAGDTCVLHTGVYRYTENMMGLGSPTNPLVVTGAPGEKVVVHNRKLLPRTWTRYSGNIWQLSFTLFDRAVQAANRDVFYRGGRVWLNEAPLVEAAWPANTKISDPNFLQGLAGSGRNVLVTPPAPSSDLAGARVDITSETEWGRVTRTITGTTAPNTFSMTGGAFGASSRSPYFRILGHVNLIKNDWQWAYNETLKRIYLQVPSGVDPNTLNLEYETNPVGVNASVAWYVLLRNMEFQGVTIETSPSTRMLQLDNVKFTYMPEIDRIDNPYDYSMRSGLVLDGNDVIIRNSEFAHCPGKCIYVRGNNALIEDNYIHDAVYMGSGEASVVVSGNNTIIQRNTIRNSGGDGIQLTAAATTGNVIRRNDVSGYGGNSLDAAGIHSLYHPADKTVRIDSNWVHDARPTARLAHGIYLDQAGGGAIVARNLIWNAGVAGFKLAGRNSVSPTGTITSTPNSVNNVFTFNTVMGSTYAVGLDYITSLTNTSFSNSLFSGAVVKEFRNFDQTYTLTAQTPSYLTSMGGTWASTVRQPAAANLFVNAAANNFGLVAGTAAIDAGTTYPEYGVNFFGAAPDLGAYELGAMWTAGKIGLSTGADPVLALDDPSQWTAPSDVVLSASSIKTEGNSSLSVVMGGYKVLESKPMTNTRVKGLGSIVLDIQLPIQQPNPYWTGAIQFYIDCPSRGLWNAWVGQKELTGLPLGSWSTATVAIPASIKAALVGTTYSDFKLRMAVNINPGTGALLLDNLRLLP